MVVFDAIWNVLHTAVWFDDQEDRNHAFHFFPHLFLREVSLCHHTFGLGQSWFANVLDLKMMNLYHVSLMNTVIDHLLLPTSV